MSAGANPHDDDNNMGMITDINVTPMVDIMLVLLIIFMVTASLIVSPSLKVDLPKASSKAAAEPDKDQDVTVVVTRTGEFRLGDKKYPSDKLFNALAFEHKKNPQARLLVIADRKTYHGHVVKVMDIAKSLGFQRLGVAINPQ